MSVPLSAAGRASLTLPHLCGRVRARVGRVNGVFVCGEKHFVA